FPFFVLSIFVLMPRPSRSTLFPYTTLFRSKAFIITLSAIFYLTADFYRGLFYYFYFLISNRILPQIPLYYLPDSDCDLLYSGVRSDEHTSELQSRENLVCRLLLEKKNDTLT